jgi:hypothetical protein
MRHLLLMVFLLPVPCFAQDRGNLADQQQCYQQAQKYVADKTASQDKKDFSGEPSEPFHFEQAHYDPKAQVCYVNYTHISYTYRADSQIGHRKFVLRYAVDDAFEGKPIAFLTVGVDTTDGYKEYVAGGPSCEVNGTGCTCEVNGTRCSSRAEYHLMVWKLIPAFKPTEAKK